MPCLLCLDWLITREGLLFALFTLFGLADYRRRVVIYFVYFVWTDSLPEKGHNLLCSLCLDWLITREGSLFALFTLFGLADYQRRVSRFLFTTLECRTPSFPIAKLCSSSPRCVGLVVLNAQLRRGT